MTNRARVGQRGAVSIFIVIFAALLVTVITVSFSRNMVREQQQAIAVDLSQSAMDSAQAGVEDAKRALLKWQAACLGGGSNCSQLSDTINAGKCNTVARMLYGQDPASLDEVKVQQSTSDEALDQAYTCTTIATETEDYQGKLEASESRLIPLKGVSHFDSIKLSWFTSSNLSSGNTAAPGSGTDLPDPGAWGENRPPMMRTQLIRAGDGFKLTDFDDGIALSDPSVSSGSGSNTLHLFPSTVGITTGTNFNLDNRSTQLPVSSLSAKNLSAKEIKCQTNLGSDPYSCSIEIAIPGGVHVSDDRAFLRLFAHYNQAHYRIQLMEGSTIVPFDGVQPEVDSTGRANDLFRRVVSRIELGDATFPYPEAAVDVGGDFCKVFTVTSRPSEYQPGASCTP